MDIKQSEKPNYYIIIGAGLFLFLTYYLYEIYFDRNVEALSGQTLVERAFLLGFCSCMIFSFFEYVIKKTFFSATIEGIISWYTGQILAGGIASFFINNYFDGYPHWAHTDLFVFVAIYGLVMIPPFIIGHILFNQQPSGFNEDLSFIIIRSPQSNEELVVDPREVLFVMAEDQSIRVFYLENGEIQSKLIAKRLTDFEKEFADIPFLTRCHHAYLVNVERISEVVREKQQLFLHYSSQYVIPVEDKFRNKILEHISR